MRNRLKFALLPCLLLALVCALAAQGKWAAPEDSAIHRFEQEGLERSRLMEVMSYLTDVYGPRLTNSPSIREAANYAVQTLNSWGVEARLEPWGPFGRGWSNEVFQAQAIAPRSYPLIAYPKAWTSGTDGPVTAEVVYAKVEKVEDLETYKGKLKGKFVMTAPLRPVEAHFEPQASRLTDQELSARTRPRPDARPPDAAARERLQAQRRLNQRLSAFLVEEGVAAWLEPSPHDGGTINVTAGGPREAGAAPGVPRVSLAIEHYGRIFRTLEKRIPVTLRLNIVNKFYDDQLDSFNIIAEIPGSDKADEVVILGAHFDSWDSGTGATDNAAGSATMMEAMRILKASGLAVRRTVRLALWTGEEQGLLGSRAYVKEHFADRQNMQLKAAHGKVSAYFNLDNGTGKIRGVYLQGNDAARPIFEKWMHPFKDLGMNTLSLRTTGGTDHVAFIEVGLPGFAFIQDPLEYDTRTHHTNMDVYERIQAEDLKQAATIIASFVYMTANAEQLLPRKPLPRPAGDRRP